jgi:hypothetical protein
MFHYIVQVWGRFKQDPQVFESLHTVNNVTFKQKLLAWVSWHTPKFFDKLKCEFEMKTMEK